MRTCFAIQPFDGGPFDKRYVDTFRPAIQAAGLEPYRVDRGFFEFRYHQVDTWNRDGSDGFQLFAARLERLLRTGSPG